MLIVSSRCDGRFLRVIENAMVSIVEFFGELSHKNLRINWGVLQYFHAIIVLVVPL